MKGLIYPVFAIVALVVLIAITVAVVTGINDARRQRAIRQARWEPYFDIIGNGKAKVGVQLAAHWGRHTKVLCRDEESEEVDVEDIMTRIEAYTHAERLAESYNALLPDGNRE